MEIKKSNGKMNKLESLVACTILVGLGIGFAYGAYKGCEFVAKKAVTICNNYMRSYAD